ncbi:MAG: response regulator [Magnetococcales bacterium]|nr:response regulator [Magnetococcales bacterium]
MATSDDTSNAAHADHIILIVEDSPIQRVMLQRLLQKHGFVVHTADDGQHGLEQATAVVPHLIISDINMPNMDGYQMCRQIKLDSTLKDIPVMILTSLADPQEVIRGLSAGADNYLTKPWDDEDLLERIQTLLHHPIRTVPTQEGQPDGLVVQFVDQEHLVTANRRQILNLLVSTYENAVQRNRQLSETQLALKALNEQLEEKVQERTKQLEEANHAKTNFINNMTHELRTPLNAIIGMTELVLSADIDQEHKHNLDIVSQSSHRLLDLINSLLDFAHLESGNLKLKPKPFFMRSEMKQLFQVFSDKAAQKGLGFLGRVRHDVPDMFIGDIQRLRAIVSQLCDNAVKFTEHGRVVVDISVVCYSISEKMQEPTIRFSVEDSGIGIAEQRKGQIFQTFIQGDGDATRQFGGTGLGLSLAQKLTQLLGGQLGFVSAENFGSVFYLQTPIRANETSVNATVHEEVLLDQPPAMDGDIQNPDQLSDDALHTAALSQLALFEKAVTDGNEDIADRAGTWLKNAAERIQSDGLRPTLLRLVMAARKKDHEKTMGYLADVRQILTELKN